MSEASTKPDVTEGMILFADDDEGVRNAFSRTLRRAHFPVRVARSGEDGLAALDAQPSAYSVVFADYYMPGMDGVAFLRQAAAIAPWATRILVSGSLDLPNVVRAVNSGALYQIVAKPWDQEMLVPLVRRARERSELSRHNAFVLTELRQQNMSLEQMNRKLDGLVVARSRSLLDGLVSALDLRDSSTKWHSRRVSKYARRLALEMGLEGTALDDVEYGALLHDIGKIGIGDDILRKPGALDEDQWNVMRTHPQLGFKLLSDIDFLGNATQIVLHHHERHDGSGYPFGLAKDEICLGARIFAVVDSLDVITSHRPYRKAMDYEWAREEIERCSGTHFDPMVVKAFLQIPRDEWLQLQKSCVSDED